MSLLSKLLTSFLIILFASVVHSYRCSSYEISCGTYSSTWCCDASESCGTYYRDCRNKPASKTDIAVVISVLVTLFALICVCIGCCFHAQNRQRRIINGNLSGTRQTAPVWSVYNDEHSRPPRSAGRVLEEPPPKYEDIPPIYEHAVIDLAAQRKPASLPAIETETSRF